jgi:hypothetical protein
MWTNPCARRLRFARVVGAPKEIPMRLNFPDSGQVSLRASFAAGAIQYPDRERVRQDGE